MTEQVWHSQEQETQPRSGPSRELGPGSLRIKPGFSVSLGPIPLLTSGLLHHPPPTHTHPGGNKSHFLSGEGTGHLSEQLRPGCNVQPSCPSQNGKLRHELAGHTLGPRPKRFL